MIEGPIKFPLGYPGTFIPLPSSKRLASFAPYPIKYSTFSNPCFEFIGQISRSSTPAPTQSFFALSTISGIQLYASPTKTTTVKAIHLCPQDPKAAPTIALRVSALSASGRITA